MSNGELAALHGQRSNEIEVLVALGDYVIKPDVRRSPAANFRSGDQ